MLTALPDRAPTPVQLPAIRPQPVPDTTGRADLTHLVTRLVEVLCNRRPAHQLQPLLTPAVQTALRVLPRHQGTLRLLSLHTCQIDRMTVELAATIATDRRARALAARAEHNGARWRLTALHVLR